MASPGGACAPELTVNIGPSNLSASGTSLFGNHSNQLRTFAPTESHCIGSKPPASYSGGVFSFDFGGGDVLSGTYSGALGATSTPGLFSNVQSYVVTGGTGVFAAGSGAFTGAGAVQILGNGYASSTQTLVGTVDIPGVPEPVTWSVMTLGMFGLGGMLRRRRLAPLHA